MAIRSTAKAIVIDGDSVLLCKSIHENGVEYYDLPGGGQNLYEPLEDTVVREVLEETGYDVRIERFAALAEEIYHDSDLQRKYPDYTHAVLHIFIARLNGAERHAPTDVDPGMEKCVWVPIDEVEKLCALRPDSLRTQLDKIVRSDGIVWLGTTHMNVYGD